MSRKNRFAPPGHWLHITQRGNDKQRVFVTYANREYFVALMATRSEERAVRIAAYGLMSNHFHLVAVGDQPDAVSLFLMVLNGLYATHRNVTHRHTGRVWKGRFYSAVLDPTHWATALRYTELNPVRAPMVARAEDWEWSSARAHLGLAPKPAWLDTCEFAQNWPSPEDWRQSLGTLTRREAAALRLATRHDTAFGSPEFVGHLERKYGVQAAPGGSCTRCVGHGERVTGSKSIEKCGDFQLHRIFVRLNLVLSYR